MFACGELMGTLITKKTLMGKIFGVTFLLMGTQNRSKTPYGKDFGWTPPTPGEGCNKLYSKLMFQLFAFP